MDREELEVALMDDLRRVHGVHTIILYGSHARGDASAESDIDVATFADIGEAVRDARLWNGIFLDAFVYPNARADKVDADLLKLCDGRVLLDERGIARLLLERLRTLEAEGPPALAGDESRMRRVWARKMLGRIQRGDLEAQYRRHWLLYQLLEDYFALRREWYLGPSRALARLRRDAPPTFAAFERALARVAPLDTLDALVEEVVGRL